MEKSNYICEDQKKNLEFIKKIQCIFDRIEKQVKYVSNLPIDKSNPDIVIIKEGNYKCYKYSNGTMEFAENYHKILTNTSIFNITKEGISRKIKMGDVLNDSLKFYDTIRIKYAKNFGVKFLRPEFPYFSKPFSQEIAFASLCVILGIPFTTDTENIGSILYTYTFQGLIELLEYVNSAPYFTNMSHDELVLQIIDVYGLERKQPIKLKDKKIWFLDGYIEIPLTYALNIGLGINLIIKTCSFQFKYQNFCNYKITKAGTITISGKEFNPMFSIGTMSFEAESYTELVNYFFINYHLDQSNIVVLTPETSRKFKNNYISIKDIENSTLHKSMPSIDHRGFLTNFL